MPNLMRKLYSPIVVDVLFAGVGLLSTVGLVVLAAAPIPSIAPPENPLAKAIVQVVLVIVSAGLAVYSTRADQRLADDYMFLALTRSALMAIMSFVFVIVLWELLFAASLGRLASQASLALLLACWSVSYFITRVRGTAG